MSALPPFPTGWYSLGTSDSLRPGELQSRRLFGESLVVYRTASGRPAASFATCPHLGGNLAQGSVCGEHLRCPFHHFEFDRSGRCVKSGYGDRPPKRARTRTLPIRERNGLVLAWWDDGGEEPSWEIPEHEPADFNLPRVQSFQFPGHPQETTENSVDIGHFTTVHGFDGVDVLEPLSVDGPYLTAKYGFVHRLGPLAWDVEFTVHCWGLGYSMVDVWMPRTDIRTRLWVLPIPTEARQLELGLGAAAQGIGPIRRALRPLIRSATLAVLCRDASEDIPIWSSRVHVERPALAKGDGPIGPYRRWARQFYPELALRAAEVA